MSEMDHPLDLTATRQNLTELQKGLQNLYEQILKDHKETLICKGYAEYMRETPTAYLDRAEDRLGKHTYKVAFAGGFSGGKSTLINALLNEPNLLPAGAGECTMSITIITSPKEGVDEHIRIYYWSREDALKNLMENERYKNLFAQYRDQLKSAFTEEKALDAVSEVIGQLGESLENQDKRRELLEFLDYLQKYSSRLGQCHIDKPEHSSQFLTTDKDNLGLGHLLLIEQVHIYKRNPLFVQKGIEIVDLPGTDSTNVRQKELTHGYLSEADVVILVLEPKGFKSADIDIGKELSKHNNEIRNKMFFVINMFDRLDLDEISKDEVEKLYRAQIVEQIIKNGLDPKRVYLTSAKWVELLQKKERNSIDGEEGKVLDRMTEDCKTKLQSLSPDLNPDLSRLMKNVYITGGVAQLRSQLIEYLEYDIQRDRLLEIFTDLDRIYQASSRLIGPEREKVSDLIANLKNQSRQTTEYFSKASGAIAEKLSLLLDEIKLKQVLSRSLEDGWSRFAKGMENFVEKGIPFHRIRSAMAVPTPMNIKSEAIDLVKKEVPQKYMDLLSESAGPPIISKLQEILTDLKLRDFFGHFSEELSGDWLGIYESQRDQFLHHLKLLTELRIREELWPFQSSPLKPKSYESSWTNEIEETFKKDLLGLLTETFRGYTNRLGEVLWIYYKAVVEKMVFALEELLVKVEKSVKLNPDGVTFPDFMIEDSSLDPQEQVKLKLAKYCQLFDSLEGLQTKLASIENS